MDKELFKTNYIEFKRKFLLDEDIEIMTKINSYVINFPQIKDVRELIDVESSLSSLGYQFAGVLGRLSGQVQFLKNSFSKKQTDIVKQKKEGKKPTEITGLAAEVKSEFHDEVQELAMLEAIYDEYSKRFHTLSDVHIAITHRMKKLDKNL